MQMISFTYLSDLPRGKEPQHPSDKGHFGPQRQYESGDAERIFFRRELNHDILDVQTVV